MSASASERAHQRDTEPARARRNEVQEVLAPRVLEARDLIAAPRRRCRPVKPQELVAAVGEKVGDDVEHGGELGVDEGFAALGLELAQDLVQDQQLARRVHDPLVRHHRVHRGKEVWVVAQLPEVHQQRVQPRVLRRKLRSTRAQPTCVGDVRTGLARRLIRGQITGYTQ
eukprot:2199341-Rhodomonas_salina.1